MVVNGSDDDFLERSVHVFYYLIVVDVVLVLLVCDGDVAVCGVEGYVGERPSFLGGKNAR